MSSERGLRKLAVPLFCAATIVVVGCRTVGGLPPGGSAFLDAATAAGAPVRAEEIVNRSSGTDTFTIAPITSWENTPATALRDGADIAFIYVSGATETIPAGYYKVRARADVSQPGTIPARIEFIDPKGNVAGTAAGTTNVHSLTLPESASTRRTFVTVRDEPREKVAALPRVGPIRVIVLCCPNGDCFIFVLA